MPKSILTADSRGRINLGATAVGKSYKVRQTADGEINLVPVTAIPDRELWLHTDNEDRASFERGIEDIKAGRVVKVDFSAYYEGD